MQSQPAPPDTVGLNTLFQLSPCAKAKVQGGCDFKFGVCLYFYIFVFVKIINNKTAGCAEKMP